MKVLSMKEVVEVGIENGALVEIGNISYLYELSAQGIPSSKLSVIQASIVEYLNIKGYTNSIVNMDGNSFHNLKVSAFGPYILKPNGEQIYTFRLDGTMVKLDPNTKNPDKHYYVRIPRGLYGCSSQQFNDAVQSVEYVAVLNSGSLSFTYKNICNGLTLTVLSPKQLPDEITVEQKFDNDNNVTDLYAKGDPVNIVRLLLGLLDEEVTNGNESSHKV